MSLIFVRHASGRATKKIPVQLMCDVPAHGVKGQIIRLSEGAMRNNFQPQGLATYVIKGNPLRIPEVKVAPKPLLESGGEGASERVGARLANQNYTQEQAEAQSKEREQSDKVDLILSQLTFPGERNSVSKKANRDGVSSASKAAGASVTENMPLGSQTAAKATKDIENDFEWQNNIVANIGKPGTK